MVRLVDIDAYTVNLIDNNLNKKVDIREMR